MKENSAATRVTPHHRRVGPSLPIRFLSRRGAPAVLIGLFLILAVLPDLIWPSRKSYFATYTCDFKNFTVLHPVLPLFLVASPVYLESMRAFGYQSLSHPVVILAIYFVLLSRRYPPAAAGAALFSALTLPLYVTSRAVLAVLLLFWGTRLRSCWRQLLIFSVLFVLLAAAAAAVSGKPPLGSWRHFIFPEEQAGLRPVVEEGVLGGNLRDHLVRSLSLAAGYLLNLGRVPFADRDCASRLFNPAYTPFLFLGLAGLWRRRGDGAILVLLLLGIFFLLPLASREVQPRRILLGIYPLYLLIVLGMAECYRCLRRKIGFLSGRLGWVLFIPLLAAAGWDVREYLLLVSRPRLNYPAPSRGCRACFSSGSGSAGSRIRQHPLRPRKSSLRPGVVRVIGSGWSPSGPARVILTAAAGICRGKSLLFAVE